MIFYALNSPNFENWLLNENILKALEPVKKNSRYVELDPMFCAATDEDYDLNLLVVVVDVINYIVILGCFKTTLY